MTESTLFSKSLFCIRTFALWAGVFAGAAVGGTFDTQIAAFEAQDGVTPPPKDPVLFVGSSTIVGWTGLTSAFPAYPVMNRGFGGSQMSDVLYYFDRVVLPYKPALAVIYEGDNDVVSKTVDQIVADYTTFLTRMRAQLPTSDIAFISTKPSPARVAYIEKTRELNSRIQALCDGMQIRFIDTFHAMLDTDGQPRAELFKSDMLHMNSSGYELWQGIVGPALNRWNLSRGQALFFDFGTAELQTFKASPPGDPANFWNNVTAAIGTSATGMLGAIVTASNAPTDISLGIIQRFNGPNSTGSSACTLFPLNAVRDSLYGNTELWSGLSDIHPKFKLTNLDPALRYYFTFYGSRDGASDNRETVYTVEGATSASAALDPANNVSSTALIPGIAPAASGEIAITLAPGSNNNNENHFTYLNVMKVDVAPPQTPITFTRMPSDQAAPAYTTALFSAEAQGARPYRVQWYVNGSAVPGANGFDFELAATPEMDQAVVSVSVSNMVYGALSPGAVLSVTADVTAPALISVASVTGETVDATFSEPLSADSVRSGHFLVNGEPVAGAVLSQDSRTITLTLHAIISGIFTVSASHVKDLSSNILTTAASASGAVLSLDPMVFLIDFGGTDAITTDPSIRWNNVTTTIGNTSTGVLPALVSTQNRTSNISIRMVRRFNGHNSSGTGASGIYPTNATRDSLFGNTESFNGLVNVFPCFKLSGLEKGWRYNLTFYASRMSATDNRETRYTVEGATTSAVFLNAANNLSQRVSVQGVAPNIDREIVVSITPGPNNNNSVHFTYLNVLDVKAVFVPRLLASRTSEGGVVISWAGTGVLQSAVSPGGPWTPVPGAPVTPYMPAAVPGGPMFFRVYSP